jgi:TonB family protein
MRSRTLWCVTAATTIALLSGNTTFAQVPAPASPERASGKLPRYPDDARQRGVGGVVTLDATLDPSGKVTDVKLIRSIPSLEAAAVAAVKEWRYKTPAPAKLTILFLFDGTTGTVEELKRFPAQGPQPKKTKTVPATYPASITGNRTGRVVLDVVVNASGKVIDTRAQSGTSGFEGAAREAVRQWEYQPVVVNGKAVPFVATVTVLFSR